MRFHDQFCGGGGSTLGAVMAGGEPVVAMNHWPVACDTYAANHPGARVDCADVVTVDPRRYPPADLLLTSPECTHHSYARGRAKDDPSLFDPDGDLAAERSRATMWDVPRFAEHHEYEAIVVENVEAAVKWGLPKGRKLEHGAYGPLFAAWLNAMDALGYAFELVHLNSMVCGVPQSRDRLYVVFWRKTGRRPDLDIRPPCWCPACERLVQARQAWKRPGATTGSYGAQYVYRCPDCRERCAPVITPAAAAIDWTLPAQRIADRARPLAPATMARIRRGLDRLASRPPVAMLVQVGGNTFERPGYSRTWPLDAPMPVVTRTADRAVVLSNMANNVPRIAGEEPAATVTSGGKLALVYAGRENAIPRPADEPSPALTTINSLYLVEPMQIDLRGGNQPRGVDEPLSTVHARGVIHGLAYVVANYTPGWMRDPASRELGTVTTSDHHALLTYRGTGAVRCAS